MPLDAITMTAVAAELREKLIGGKVDKIYQPTRDEVVLHMRANGGNVKLLLSANPAHPRAQLTAISRENPETPPMFCMLMRKHFLGGRVLDISQPPMERVLDFKFETLNDLGDRVERRIVLECIGRKSNLIMLDGAGRITDCMRRVDADISAQRPLMPGLFYDLPTPTGKTDPTAMSEEELRVLVLEKAPEGEGQSGWLLETFSGISPLVARELEFRSDGSRENLALRLAQLAEDVRGNKFTPVVLKKGEKAVDFSFMPILQYGPEVELIRYDSFSALLDDYYAAKEAQERVKQRGQDFIRSVTQARNRTAKKIANQEEDLRSAENREQLRQFGDIITTNFYQMQKGQTLLRAQNYYDPDCAEVEIPLDPLLTPQQNAAKYYKDYNKAKTAEQMLTVQLEKGRQELDYLNSVLESVTRAEGERDLQEIRQELVETGYLRRASKARGREKKVVSKPMEFFSAAGLRISVGKNNAQNDLLTTKMASKSDIWFHTQKIHGSHVILWTEGSTPDVQSLNEAACLAAWFSQGREGSKVPVDYTPVKFVKKPAGARPGMVVYTTYETAWVAPDEDLVKRLRVKNEAGQ